MARVYKRKEHQSDPTRPWIITWNDWVPNPHNPNGPRIRKTRTTTGTTSKRQSLLMGQDLEREAKAKARGTRQEAPDTEPCCLLPGAFVPGLSSLAIESALDAWAADMARRQTTPKHRRASLATIRAIATLPTGPARTLLTVAELKPAHLIAALEAMRARGCSATTIDHARARAQAFTRFVLLQLHALDRDPFAGVRKVAGGRDPRLERRALTDHEAARLVYQTPPETYHLLKTRQGFVIGRAGKNAEAQSDQTRGTQRGACGRGSGERQEDSRECHPQSLSLRTSSPLRVSACSSPGIALDPPTRSLLYRLALDGGLRLSDIRHLTPGDLQPDGTIVIDAAGTKSRKKCVHPLPAELHKALAERAADRPLGRPIFTLPPCLAIAVYEDCARLGIPFHDPADPSPSSPKAERVGKRIRGVVDFHALRHTYVTRLVRAGIPLAQVQILARHADVATTLKHYTHLSTAETAAALAALPPLTPPLATTPAPTPA